MYGFKRLILTPMCVLRLLAGWTVYLVSGRTPAFAYQSMVMLFCMTGGRSNDVLSRLIGVFKPPYRLADGRGVLGDMGPGERRDAVLSQLRSRGYYVFERCLPPDMCARLMQFALTQPCKMRRMDGGKPGSVVKELYSRGAPEAIRYDFDAQDLLGNHDIQKLLADPSFLALAQEYLGARPFADVLNMWWHTSFAHGPDSEAGQFFHFDMDRPKWLKIFIYLTDVTPESGPHAFVAGSQRTDGIPQSLLRKGYVRLSDDEVSSRFEPSDILELTAPCGSIIVEDTRGLHKGKHVERGDRLMLQIQFSNSLFGGFYAKSRLGAGLCVELQQRVEQYRGVYSAYL